MPTPRYRLGVTQDRALAAADELVEAGELDGARARLRAFLTAKPQHLEARERLAEIYRRQGNAAQAGRWSYLGPTVDRRELSAFRRAYQRDPVRLMAALSWRGSEDEATTEVARERLRAVRADAEAHAGTTLGWEDPLRRRSEPPTGFVVDQDWRAPTPYEAELLAKLLEVEFDGRLELLQQWRTAMVRTSDEDGCFDIRSTPGSPPCRTRYRVPVEAESPVEDGGSVHALLHVDDDGYMREVEFYEDANGWVRHRVDPATMETFAPPWRP